MTIGAQGFMEIGSLSSYATKKKTHSEIMTEQRRNRMDDVEKFHAKLDDQIKLMCAMIKNQMPDSEADPQKIMEPIFHTMQAEQMVLMNYNMHQMRTSQEKQFSIDAQKLMGSDVEVKTKGFTFEGKTVEFSYELPEHVDNPKCQIFSVNDPKNPVHTLELDADQLSGKIKWTGHLPNDELANEGGYVIRVSGASKREKNKENEPLRVDGETSVFMPVDGVKMKENKTLLTSGHMLFDRSDILSVKRNNSFGYKYQTNQQETQTEPQENLVNESV